MAITQLLKQWQQGDNNALNEIVRQIYPTLQSIAAAHLRREHNRGQLQTTLLVHEVYERLIGVELDWSDRNHFLAIYSRLIRQYLVDNARKRSVREGSAAHTLIDTSIGHDQSALIDIVIVDDLLNKLKQVDERKSQLAELFYFGGASQAQVSDILGISIRTVRRDLQFLKAWFSVQLAME